MINVTKPFLPDLDEYIEKLKIIWENNWLTNNGPLLNELELKLKKELNLSHLLFLGNGTIAIQIAMQCLDLKKKILTTPFSYIATLSSILWERCEPVFVDINEETWNIDETKLETAIEDDVEAIIATHVFGNPCHVTKIDEIAKKHNLKVIYDAAHAFGVTHKNQSLLNYGDISTVSFHATKLFHTVEGGVIVTKHPELLEKMAMLRNFGHKGPEKFGAIGINGKNSEFHAAMGLCNLNYIDDIKENREKQYAYYKDNLNSLNVQFQKISEDTSYNYSYFPLVFETEEVLLKVINSLNNHKVFPRRYFYPSLNTVSILNEKTEMPVAEGIAKRILCLPMFHTLEETTQNMICRIIKRALRF